MSFKIGFSNAVKNTLLALALAIGVILFQVYNVEIVGTGINTLFGPVSTGIWVSTIEIEMMVALQMLLGSFTALGVILTSFAFSLAVKNPSFVGPTIWSKVITLLSTAIIIYICGRKKQSNMVTLGSALLVGLQVDVFAFALLAHLPSIIVPSLLIRFTLWAATMLLCLVMVRWREQNYE